MDPTVPADKPDETPPPAGPDAAVADRVETPVDDTPPAVAGVEAHVPEAEPPAVVEGEEVGADEVAVTASDDAATEDGGDAPPSEEVAAGAAGAADEAAAAPAEEPPPPPPDDPKKWYVVKVQSGREETIKKDIERKVKIRGLEGVFGSIAVPVEEYYEKKKVSVKDKKTGQRVTEERNVTKRRKKFPGYIFANVEFGEDILYLFRETSGVGDFVGATHTRAPNPMPDREVQQMLTGVIDPKEKGANRKIKVKLDFEKGDKVRIRDGAFAGSEGEVKAISEPKDPTDIPKVTVVVSIWGRPVELELESLQVDKV